MSDSDRPGGDHGHGAGPTVDPATLRLPLLRSPSRPSIEPTRSSTPKPSPEYQRPSEFVAWVRFAGASVLLVAHFMVVLSMLVLPFLTPWGIFVAAPALYLLWKLIDRLPLHYL